MKNIKKILLTITIILFILLIIFMSFKIYQYNTVKKITKTIIDKRDSLDFFFEISEENSTSKNYVKNNKIKHEYLDKNGNIVHIQYIDTETQMVYTLYTINKAYEVTSGHHYSQSFINMPNTFTLIKNTLESTLLDKIKLALSISSMTTEKLNNTETIKIEFNYPINSSEYLTETVWYNINTLYPIKVISNLHPQNATYKITSCPLSEEELVFTNKEGYKEIIKSENDSNN